MNALNSFAITLHNCMYVSNPHTDQMTKIGRELQVFYDIGRPKVGTHRSIVFVYAIVTVTGCVRASICVSVCARVRA